MKWKKYLILIAAFLIAIISYYKFNTYPKKIVASALYSVETRAISAIDDYFEGLELGQMYNKIKADGDATFSILIDKGIFYRQQWNYISTTDVTNKSKYLYKKYRRGTNYEEVHEEKVINNEVYIIDPEYAPNVFYIDRNTMKSLSENSTALVDLGYDTNKPNLFEPPLSLSEQNNELKKYVKEEWNDVLRSTKVRTTDTYKYQIVLDSKKFKSLVDKVFEFNSTRDDFSYERIAEFLNKTKMKLDLDLINRDKLKLYLITDEDGNLTKLYSKDLLYFLDMDDGLSIHLPDLHMKLKRDDSQYYNTIAGYIDSTHIRMSYYPIEQNLIYRDNNNILIKANFINVYKGRSFNLTSDIKGSLINHINFNLYTKPKDISRDKDTIEVLKLNQKQWNHLKNKRKIDNAG